MERIMKYKPLSLFTIIILSIILIQPGRYISRSKNPTNILFVINDFTIFEDGINDNSERYYFDLCNLKDLRFISLYRTAVFSCIKIIQFAINHFMKYSVWSKGTFT